MSRCEAPTRRPRRVAASSLLRLDGKGQSRRASSKQRRNSRGGGVLELGEELDESLAERRHDVGGVEGGETTNDLNGDLANGVDLVVQRDEERADALGLRKVAVELGVEVRDRRLANTGVCSSSKIRNDLSKQGGMVRSEPGSAMASVRSFSRTSLTSLMAWFEVWVTTGSLERTEQQERAAARRMSGLSSSTYRMTQSRMNSLRLWSTGSAAARFSFELTKRGKGAWKTHLTSDSSQPGRSP